MQKATAPMKALVFLENRESISNIEYIQLPHPQNGEKRWFGISNDKIYETIQVKDEHSSLLLSCDRVVRDGGLYLQSLVDPVFIVMSELIRHSQTNDGNYRAVFPDQVFSPEICRILNLPTCKIEHVALVQEAFDEECLIFQPEKAISWLKKKVERLQAVLDTGGADGLKQSLGLIAEYINKSMLTSLLEHYSLSVKEVYRSPRKRKVQESVPDMDGPCRPAPRGPVVARKESIQPKVVKKPKKEKPKAYGMKSLASYFQKKR